MTPSDASSFANFGKSVSVNEELLVVGAELDGGFAGYGAAYVYSLDGLPVGPDLYGDLDRNGVINLFDLFCVLNAFSGNFPDCTFEDVDINPCVPDGVINIFDLFAVLIARAVAAKHCQTPAVRVYRSLDTALMMGLVRVWLIVPD